MNTKLITSPTIGTDFELFVADRESREIISAEGYAKGTKHKPYHFDPDEKWYTTSLDNVLFEGTIPPVGTSTDFIKNIKKTLAFINASLPGTLCTVAEPAAILDDKWLQTKTAKLFGCEPSANVWLRAMNDPPKADNPNLRSAGFHVHVGFKKPDVEALQELGIDPLMGIEERAVKCMDLLLGVPAVLLEPENDRRKLYGKAGECRFKEEYGFEYRVLSGFFMGKEEYLKWIFDNTMKAIDFVNEDRIEEVEAVGTQIQTAINNSDKVLAANLIRQFEITMP